MLCVQTAHPTDIMIKHDLIINKRKENSGDSSFFLNFFLLLPIKYIHLKKPVVPSCHIVGGGTFNKKVMTNNDYIQG